MGRITLKAFTDADFSSDPILKTSFTPTPWRLPAEPMELLSSDPADAGTVYIEGVALIGGRFLSFTTTTPLAGTTPQAIAGVADILRVNRMTFSSSGTSGDGSGVQNLGEIRARITSLGDAGVRCSILPTWTELALPLGGRGVSEWGVWAAGENQELKATSFHLTRTGSAAGRVIFWDYRELGDYTWRPAFEMWEQSEASCSGEGEVIIPAGHEMRVRSAGGSGFGVHVYVTTFATVRNLGTVLEL